MYAQWIGLTNLFSIKGSLLVLHGTLVMRFIGAHSHWLSIDQDFEGLFLSSQLSTVPSMLLGNGTPSSTPA